MERYWLETGTKLHKTYESARNYGNDYSAPDGRHEVVFYADAQATVEALLQQELLLQGALKAQQDIARHAEALQRERDDAVLLRDHNLRRCDVLDSKYKKGLAAVKVLQSQLSQLQALVRALPVVRIDLDGAYHDTLLAQPEDDAVKELLQYLATLDATTPATTKT